jgi:GNAT superfamily N-acetyltransferase
MASSEVLEIERLDIGDVAGGLALSDAAGWNQTGEDWRFFLAEGEAFGLRDESGGLIASAAALPYDGAVGWISMVLVDAKHRHRGLATRLLDACTQSLRRAGRVPVLDATPAGAEVYRRLGFRAGFAFERWQGEGGTAGEAGIGEGVVAATSAADIDALLALDRAVHGVGRDRLLRDFLARPATRAWHALDASGFALSRAGRRATQIGPLIADDEGAALALLVAALVAAHGPVFIDVPVHQPALARCLEARGFVRQRPFVRMALADTPCLDPSARVFAVAGPEFG